MPKQSLMPYMDSLPEAEVILFQTPNVGATNQIMMATKGNRFFFALMTHMQFQQKSFFAPTGVFPALDILCSTGPLYLSSLYNAFHTKFSNSGVVLLHRNAIGKRAICSAGRDNLEKGLFEHRKGDSWLKETNWYADVWRFQRQLVFCNMFLTLLLLMAIFRKLKGVCCSKGTTRRESMGEDSRTIAGHRMDPISHGSFVFFFVTSFIFQFCLRTYGD